MIGRRAILAAMGGLPIARPDQHYEPPRGGAEIPGSRTGVFRGRLVIIFGPAGTVEGVFVYAPGTTPGPGNPPTESMTESATDPFGNAVQKGVTTYNNGSKQFAELLAGQINWSSFNPLTFITAPAFAKLQDAISTLAAPGLLLASPTAAPGQPANLSLLGGSNSGSIASILAAVASVTPTLPVFFEIDGTTGITASVSAANVLHIINALTSSKALVALDGHLSTDLALGLQITGDAIARFMALCTGAMTWGDGTHTRDCALYRAAAGQLGATTTAADVGGLPESLHAPTFANSWVNAGAPGPNLQYQLVAAPYNNMQWVGRVTAPGGIAAGQAITAALPAAYQPAHGQNVPAVNVSTGAIVRIFYTSAGVLTYESGAVAGNNIDIGGLVSLNA